MDAGYFLSYVGSKYKMAELIISLMPPHEVYIEPFGGTGAVLIAKEPAPLEVYNDINQNLVSFFRVLQDPRLRRRLIRRLNWTPYSRIEFEDAQRKLLSGKELDPVDRAWCTFVRANQGFVAHGGKLPWGYGLSGTVSPPADFRRHIAQLEAVGRRLLTVQIECRHFMELFDLYESVDAVWYLDPPYYPDTRSAGMYDCEMYAHEHKMMVDRLLAMRGTFFVSGYDNPVYARLDAAGWRRHEFERAVSAGGAGADGQRARKTEVIWTNATERRVADKPPAKVTKSLTEGGHSQLSLFGEA